MKMLKVAFSILVTILILLGISQPSYAQPVPSLSQREKIKSDKVADPLGRDTPRGTVSGFLSAVSDNNLPKAAQYLDITALQSPRPGKVQNLAKGLQVLLDKGGRIDPPAILSGELAGKQNDDQPDDVDKIGTIHSGNKDVDILLQHVSAEKGTPIWLFSTQTVSRIEELQKDIVDPLINRFLPDSLRANKWHGAPIGHWLAVIVIFIISYSAVWIAIHGAANFTIITFLKTKSASILLMHS